MEYIIQIIAGLAGGNGAGAAGKNLSLGTAGNSIAGALGGLGGGQILSMLMAGGADAAAGGGIGGLIGQIVASGAGGAILTAIVGLIKNRMAS